MRNAYTLKIFIESAKKQLTLFNFCHDETIPDH